MNDIIDDLRNDWKSSRNQQPTNGLSPSELITKSQDTLRKADAMQVGNVSILVLTVIGISAFFIWVAPFRDTLSHIGMALMIGGLLVRIFIEFQSIYRSRKIDLSEAAQVTNDQFLHFYTFRKRIHGPVTITILAAYTIGFYLLIPEFSLYLEQKWVILLSLSYLLAAAIFGFSIRIAIRKEMIYLNEIRSLREEMKD